MTSRSWGPPKGWALASALLHAATLSLLFSGWRELSALSELRHPSHQSSSMSASPGRRLQALGEPGGPSPLRSSGGGSPPRTARPTPASQVVGGLEQARPGGAGGARPASAAFGEELPINHLANDPAYVAGSGALTDPLSCLWVNPQTGTLWVRCKLSVEPAPYAATATPPPQYAAARTAVEIVGDAGAPGLGVAGGAGSAFALTVLRDDTPASMAAPMLVAANQTIRLAATGVYGDLSPQAVDAFAVYRGKAPGQYAASVYNGTATSDLVLWYTDLTGGTVQGPLEIRGDQGPSVRAALEVTGASAAQATVWVRMNSTSGYNSLAVQSGVVLLGPTAIFGDSQPEATHMLQIGPSNSRPDMGFLNVFRSNAQVAANLPELELVAGKLTINTHTTTINPNGVVPAPKSAVPTVRVLGSAAVDGALSARTLSTTGTAKFGGDVTVGASGRGQQRGLTVTGRLNVKMDALFESSVEIWRSVTARWYYWWRPNHRHYPFAAPADNTPAGSRKL